MSFTGYLLICIVLVVLSIGLLAVWIFADPYDSIVMIVATMLAWGGALAMCIITFVGIPVSSHYAHVHCDRFSEQTERDVKWSRYTYASWDCLVRTDEGWVGIDHVVKVDD